MRVVIYNWLSCCFWYAKLACVVYVSWRLEAGFDASWCRITSTGLRRVLWEAVWGEWRMRRHSVRLLKYLIVAALFLTLGPVTVKLMFGDHHEDFSERQHVRRQRAVPHGLPVDPDELQVVRHSSVSCVSVLCSCHHSIHWCSLMVVGWEMCM